MSRVVVNGFKTDYNAITKLFHGEVTIIFVVSVCLYVCLSVCLFVCAEFFSAVFDPISIKLGHMLCLGLVVSPRI